jgi:hypothetical protein
MPHAPIRAAAAVKASIRRAGALRVIETLATTSESDAVRSGAARAMAVLKVEEASV